VFPADERLWRGTRTGSDFAVSQEATDEAPVALLGIRGCDLAAMRIHDTVLLGRQAIDVHYARRREQSLLIAVTCASPAATCFCASMGTGPRPGDGADLVLTELLDADGHRFLVEAESSAGVELLAGLNTTEASASDHATAEAVVVSATARMGREMRTDDLRDLLYASAESSRWNDVAERCLACTNCTLVCPTCFCTSVEDVSDLSGDVDDRHRVWDSCFSMEYSRLHGGAVRSSTSARYRQWLTHKLAAWQDQFGTSGCVGCGRCITWCPAAIDLTEEVTALREDAAHRQTALTGAPRPSMD
jgi:sulfhydrogenase subunit beta (sulfur reductase)